MSARSHLRVSTPALEGVFNASKWLKIQVLLDAEEMEELFLELSPFFLFNVSQILRNPEIPAEKFLESYRIYCSSLREESKPKVDLPTFSAAMTTDLSGLYALQVRPGEWMAKIIKPAIQIQYHQFLPSRVDGGFHPMIHGPESVSWGLQFSYPQLFQDPHSKEYLKIDDSEMFPNTQLYSKLAKWMRAHTVPATFVWNAVKKATPLRLGKKCFSWIGHHSQLVGKGIQIYEY